MNDVTNLHGPDDPDTEARLAGALRREAETIHPGPRLDAIRREGRRRHTSRMVGLAAAAMVGAVAAGLVVGVLVQRDGPTSATGNHEVHPAATGAEPNPSTAAPPSSPPHSSPPRSSTSSTPPRTTATATVPVYWLGGDDKLYREYLPATTTSDSRVVEAVETMLAGSPLDPDYRKGPWQATTGVIVSQRGQDLTVDLPADAFDTGAVSEAEARQAVQQLVYTATAAIQSQGTVTVLIDGRPGRAWDRVEVGEPMKRDVSARATVWITSPQQDERRPAGTVTIEGSATAFEGTVTWAVTRPDGTTVANGHTMAGANGEYGTYAIEVDLEPGTYVVTVTAPDMSGRTDGVSDTKTFTVA